MRDSVSLTCSLLICGCYLASVSALSDADTLQSMKEDLRHMSSRMAAMDKSNAALIKEVRIMHKLLQKLVRMNEESTKADVPNTSKYTSQKHLPMRPRIPAAPASKEVVIRKEGVQKAAQNSTTEQEDVPKTAQNSTTEQQTKEEGESDGFERNKHNFTSLAFSTQFELILFSFGKKKITKIPVHYPVDSLVYDDQKRRLYFGSKRRSVIGYYSLLPRNFHPSIIVRSHRMTGDIALDAGKQWLFYSVKTFLYNQIMLTKLTGGITKTSAPVSRRGINNLRLMVDSKMGNLLVVTLMEYETLEVTTLDYSLRKTRKQRLKVNGMNLNTLVYAQENVGVPPVPT